MLHAGLDLSKKRLDVCLLPGQGGLVEELTSSPGSGSPRALAQGAEADGRPVQVIRVERTTDRLGR